MDASVPVFEKPHPRLSFLDWTRNIQRLQNEARTRRFESYQLCQTSNQLRNESNVTTRWDNYVNNELLRDRIFEVESWRENQRFTREQVRDEIRALKEEKNATELHLESLQVPLSVLLQCISNRDQRVPPELTRDLLGEELNKELHIIENNKRVLTDVCNMGWEKIKELTNVYCRLEREIQNKDDALLIEHHVKDLDRESSDISYKLDPTRVPPDLGIMRLEREIQNKDDALLIEHHVKDLDRESSDISYKLDPTRVPPDTMSEKSYVDCIQNTIKIAEQLMNESKALRETMFRSREQASNQMYAQCQNVEMVMRRRIFDTQRARNEMEWQKYKLESNLQKTNREIESLRAAIADKINPTKLVETRLEMRTRRPVLERVQDKAMNGLIEEFERVHLSTNMLEKKLEEALTTYHGLHSHHERVTKDLQYKNQSLETDRRLIEIRKPLHGPNETELQRNIGYCHMNDELIPE